MDQQETQPVIEDSFIQGEFIAARSYQFGQSRVPLARIEEAVLKSLPDLEARKRLAAWLITLLGDDSTADAKDFACRQIAVLDAAEAVPALTQLLDAESNAEMALLALESITHNSAAKALRGALDTTTGRVRVGAITALGRRHDHPAVPSLGALLLDSDPMVSEASARALGMIRGTSAYMALSKALPKIPAKTHQRIGDALLACAEDLVAQEKLREAAWIYTQLHTTAESGSVRKAAQLGLERIKG